MTKTEAILSKLLNADNDGKKISLFQSTHPASSSANIQEDIIRFKNGLQRVRSDNKYDESIDQTLNSLDNLLDDTEFWKHRTVGLVIFGDEKGYEAVSLPHDIDELSYVDNQFLVTPLALMNSLGSDFYVLDINHTRPRLVEVSSVGCQEVKLESMPSSFEEMTANIEYGKDLQHQSGGSDRFHGHTDEAALQDDAMRYYRKIVEAVENHLEGHDDPVVLVGTENRIGEIRKLLTYHRVLEDYIEGNGEHMDETGLCNAGRPLVEKYNQTKRQTMVNQFAEIIPDRKLIGIDEIHQAAQEGRIDTLFVPSYRITSDTVREGFDESIVVELSDDNKIEPIEAVVRDVLSSGGRVQAVALDAFEDDQLRASCRY